MAQRTINAAAIEAEVDQIRSLGVDALRGTTPAKNRRTECCCQFVAFIMAAIVVPSACRSRPRTFSCFDSARGLDVIDFCSAPALGWTLLMEAASDFRFVVTILVSSREL
jgi:hypothetical protein